MHRAAPFPGLFVSLPDLQCKTTWDPWQAVSVLVSSNVWQMHIGMGASVICSAAC